MSAADVELIEPWRRLAAAAGRLPDAELLELDRAVSRLAAHARRRDPVYLLHLETGKACARERDRLELERRARARDGPR